MPYDGGNFKKAVNKGATFVRFYASDWRSGCIGLSCEEEGFYWRICAHYYETGMRLPLDADTGRARIGNMDRRPYSRLIKALVSKGLLHETDDGYSVPRCEEELRLALARSGEKTAVVALWENAPAEPDHRRVAYEPGIRNDLNSDQRPAEVGAKLGQSQPDFDQKKQQNQRPFIEPITNSQNSVPLTPIDSSERVRFANGRLELCDGLWTFWLEQFGGDNVRLLLALVEVGGRVQPNSSRPLEAQIGSQLARIAGDRHDRSSNYAKAVERNAKAAPATAHGYASSGTVPTAPGLAARVWAEMQVESRS